MDACAVIIGGGPAGSAVGALLASWGHRVLILTKAADRSRGLAESVPPSTEKLLAQTGLLDAVEQAGFYRSTGNTVWWGSRQGRVESFGLSRSPIPDPRSPPLGLQVYRPDFDRVLLATAVAAGANLRADATVRAVQFEPNGARVDFEQYERSRSATCRFVLDCSGRAGVIGRRYRRAGQRTYALVAVWYAPGGWNLSEPTHTLVEAYDDGWAWSVPISASTRHVGVMVDGVSPRGRGRPALADAYHAALAQTTELARLLGDASPQRIWARDASTYASARYQGPQFLLVGDAGSFIDPLSSFGVKKALASAWIAAVVVNTCVTRPERRDAALDFFSQWEREVSATHARRSRDFAREACARHPTSFWDARVGIGDRGSGTGGRGAGIGDRPPSFAGPRAANFGEPRRSAQRGGGGRAEWALQMIKESAELDLALADGTRYEKRAVIRGREIVLEEAFASGLRFRENVDLVKLARMACHHRQVPDLFDAYCRLNGPIPLPSMLGGLSLLVAKGILQRRNASPC